MDVISIKLTSGEELVTEYAGESSDYLVINRPRSLVMQSTAQGINLTFMPYALSNPDAELSVPKKAIAAIFKPTPDIEKGYLIQVSRIQL